MLSKINKHVYLYNSTVIKSCNHRGAHEYTLYNTMQVLNQEFYIYTGNVLDFMEVNKTNKTKRVNYQLLHEISVEGGVLVVGPLWMNCVVRSGSSSSSKQGTPVIYLRRRISDWLNMPQ